MANPNMLLSPSRDRKQSALAVQYPIYREWEISDDFKESPVKRMLEFRLVYQGLLEGADRDNPRSKHKHDIRRYLHKQLVKLWHTKYPLKGYIDPPESGWPQYTLVDQDGSPLRPYIERMADQYQMGGKKFVPIVRREWALTCALDILILRRDHFPVINSGDLDNRIKTLLDALRIPQVGQFCEGDEEPLFCLLEDDKLVAEIKVTADLLLPQPEQVIENPRVTLAGEYAASVNHALALIHVMVKPTRVYEGNVEFA